MMKWVVCFVAGLAGALMGFPLLFVDVSVAGGFVSDAGFALFFGSPFVFWVEIPLFLAWRRFLRRLNLKGIAKGLAGGMIYFLAGLGWAFVGLVLFAATLPPDENDYESLTGLQFLVNSVGWVLLLASPLVFWIAIPVFLAGRGFRRWLHRGVMATE